MKANWRSDDRPLRGGFSLLELMCAILILGLSIVGLSQAITAGLLSSKDAEVRTAAALLAASQIETLRAEGYVIDGETEGEGDGALSGYTWTQDVVESQPEGLYEVTVTVRKTSSGEEIYELKTMLFDPPIVRDPEEEDPNDRGRAPAGRRRT